MSPIPSSQLPAGFHSAKVGSTTPSAKAKKFHVVGEVEVDVDSGVAAIFYAVFPTHAAALADYEAAAPNEKIAGRSAAPASFPKPSKIISGSTTGTNAVGQTVTTGFTTLVFVDGNVDVAAITTSASSAHSGKAQATISLARLALSHLQQVD